MKFTVTLRKGDSPEETTVMDAPTRFAIYDQVQKDGGTVIKLVEGSGGFRLPAWMNITIGTGIKRPEIIHMAKNMSAMITAGLSLSRSLSVIERQSGNKRLKAVMVALSESIKKGSSFNEALAAFPKVFNSLFVAMVKAGEESGSLAESLATVGLQMERSEELVRKIRGAMIYPAIVITAIIIVGVLMLIFVVPTLTSTFTSLGVKLPMTTQIIVVVSDFMVANVGLVLAGLVLIGISGTMFVRSNRGKSIVLAASLYMPVIKDIVRETYAARAARTLSSLLSSGVPVLNALDISKEVVHAGLFARVIDEAEVRVRKGEALSAAFIEHPKLYPILMGDMLSVGEETGKVAEMLKQIAEFYEADVAEKTKDLSTIIEPVLMLLIGAVVGVFAVSMIGPIYSLSSAF
jgi:type IV pilus assembly protein PilC